MIGKEFDDFSFLRQIGKGAFSRVYKVYNKNDGLCYALKEIRINDKDSIESMRNESSIPQLSHDNILMFKPLFMSKRPKNIEKIRKDRFSKIKDRIECLNVKTNNHFSLKEEKNIVVTQMERSQHCNSESIKPEYSVITTKREIVPYDFYNQNKIGLICPGDLQKPELETEIFKEIPRSIASIDILPRKSNTDTGSNFKKSLIRTADLYLFNFLQQLSDFKTNIRCKKIPDYIFIQYCNDHVLTLSLETLIRFLLKNLPGLFFKFEKKMINQCCGLFNKFKDVVCSKCFLIVNLFNTTPLLYNHQDKKFKSNQKKHHFSVFKNKAMNIEFRCKKKHSHEKIRSDIKAILIRFIKIFVTRSRVLYTKKNPITKIEMGSYSPKIIRPCKECIFEKYIHPLRKSITTSKLKNKIKSKDKLYFYIITELCNFSLRDYLTLRNEKLNYHEYFSTILSPQKNKNINFKPQTNELTPIEDLVGIFWKSSCLKKCKKCKIFDSDPDIQSMKPFSKINSLKNDQENLYNQINLINNPGDVMITLIDYFGFKKDIPIDFFLKATESGINKPFNMRIWRSIVKGVKYLHSCGVYHNDLSCSNIFFSGEWIPKIGDFGMSKRTKYNSHSQNCRKNISIKKARFNDIHCIGTILLELLWPMRTQMERVNTLQILSEENILPRDFVRNNKKESYMIRMCMNFSKNENETDTVKFLSVLEDLALHLD